MRQFFSRKNLLLLIVLSILLIGAYLRLYKIADYLTFLGDEGRDALIVKRMIIDHDFVLLGPTASVGGFFLGPMYYYFMLPFLWLFNLNPVGPAVMVALFGIATIYLVYHVGKRFFDAWVGIIAASLYALSPVVIAYSRSSWNPNLVPFFSLLVVYLLWRFAMFRQKRDLLLIGLSWGLAMQFHYLFSFIVIFSVLWVIAVSWSIKSLKYVALMIGGSLVTFSPFILFELRHSFPNTQALIKFFLHGNETGFSSSTFLSTVSDVGFRSVGRLLYRMPNYELWNGFPNWQISLLEICIRTTIFISLLLLLLLSISKLGIFRKKFKSISNHISLSKEQWYGSVITVSWFILCVLLFGLYRRSIYDYYFGVFFAFPFLAVGVILWQMMRNRTSQILALIIWASLLWYNWQGRPFIYAPNKQLEQTRKVAEAALVMTGGKPYNFAFITATNSDHAYRYFFEIEGKKPVTIEPLSIDPERTSVTEQLIVMCENAACHPLGNSLWEVAGFGRAEITEEKTAFPVVLYRLVHYKDQQ